MDTGTDPQSQDTDGDGTSDVEELAQDSDPLDDLDGGEAPADDMKAKFNLYVADPSDSKSEAWQLQVGDRTVTAPLGGGAEKTLTFKVGQSYDMRLNHLATSESSPDYDWIASILPTVGSTAPYFVIDDDPKVFGTFDNTDPPDKAARLVLPQIDLDIDSDNNNGLDSPDQSPSEDRLENLSSGAKEVWVGAPQFVPISLSLSANVAQAEPSALQLTLSGWDAAFLRIWKPGFSAPGSSPSGNTITPGVPISASSIGLTPGGSVTIYVEALQLSQPVSIAASMQVTGARWSASIMDVARLITGVVDALSGQQGASVPSVKTTGVIFKHFVTPKKADAEIIVAAVTPFGANFSDHYEWGGPGSSVAGSSDKRKVSRSTPGKFVLLLKDKTTHQTLNTYIVWVVWADLTQIDLAVSPPSDFVGPGNLRLGTHIEVRHGAKAVIQPASILDVTQDVPDLRGVPAGPPLPGQDAQGNPLSGGVNAKWDMSRRIASRVLQTGNGVDLSPLDKTIDFPADALQGNDDAFASDEDNNPYDASDSGALIMRDAALREKGYDGAALNQELRVADWFQDFARLQIGSQWFLISDPLSWRLEFKLRNVECLETHLHKDTDGDGHIDSHWVLESDPGFNNDYNGNGNTSDKVLIWIDNGTYANADNVGLPSP